MNIIDMTKIVIIFKTSNLFKNRGIINKKAKSKLRFVPETGFEPARRFQRHHLKVVRLPISPPGQ